MALKKEGTKRKKNGPLTISDFGLLYHAFPLLPFVPSIAFQKTHSRI